MDVEAAGAGEARCGAAADGAISPAFMPENSATRRVKVENSITLRNAIRWV